MTDFLISPEALLPKLDAYAILDVSSSPTGCAQAQAAFEKAHIAKARFLNFEHFFSREALPEHGRHPWPDATTVRERLCAAGLSPDSPIVFCDQGALNFASRAYLLARQAGFTNLRVLDGGFALWQKLGFPVEAGRQDKEAKGSTHSFISPVDAMPALGPALMTLEAMTENLRAKTFVDLDARPAPRFHATAPSALDPLPGRIPGAINRPAAENLDEEGRMKSPERLRAEISAFLAENGVRDPKQIVQSCGSGVAACLNILAFDRAGLASIDESRIYAGSWSEWIEHPALPRETD